MVSERSLEVLRVIVEDYVASREPVGSKAIVERHSFGVSAATIRNDMAQLEEEELITAPHTSSGRVPTDKGYRVFVDQLTELRPLSAGQRQAIETFLGEAVDLDDVLARTVRLLSTFTSQVALAQYPSFGSARVRHIEVVALGPNRLMTVLITDTGRVDQRLLDVANRQDRLVVAGSANLARTDRNFRGSIYPVLEALEEQVTMLKLFGEMQIEVDDVRTSIGREHEASGLSETSVVATGYTTSGGGLAHLGVLGPTRMDYSSNMTAVRAVARYLTRLLGEDDRG